MRTTSCVLAVGAIIAVLAGACSSGADVETGFTAEQIDELSGRVERLAGTSWTIETVDGRPVEIVTLSLFSTANAEGPQLLGVSYGDSCNEGQAELEPKIGTFEVLTSTAGETAGCVPTGTLNGFFGVGEPVLIEIAYDRIEIESGDSTAVGTHFLSQSVQTNVEPDQDSGG